MGHQHNLDLLQMMKRRTEDPFLGVSTLVRTAGELSGELSGAVGCAEV